MYKFTALRFSLDNALFPSIIEIDAKNVTYYKGTVVGYQSTVIERDNIASVSISSGILFADVVIESKGGKRRIATGFRKSDTKEIVRLLKKAI